MSTTHTAQKSDASADGGQGRWKVAKLIAFAICKELLGDAQKLKDDHIQSNGCVPNIVAAVLLSALGRASAESGRGCHFRDHRRRLAPEPPNSARSAPRGARRTTAGGSALPTQFRPPAPRFPRPRQQNAPAPTYCDRYRSITAEKTGGHSDIRSRTDALPLEFISF